MTWLDLALAAGILVAMVAVTVLVVALRRDRARGRTREEAVRTEAEALRERLDDLERRLEQPAVGAAPSEAADYVITDVGTDSRTALPAGTRIEGRLFADLVLRATVVKAAALAHGVRRATSPENRFRMRYEYSREVKRARKQRRLELRRLRRAAAAGRRQEREDAA